MQNTLRYLDPGVWGNGLGRADLSGRLQAGGELSEPRPQARNCQGSADESPSQILGSFLFFFFCFFFRVTTRLSPQKVQLRLQEAERRFV